MTIKISHLWGTFPASAQAVEKLKIVSFNSNLVVRKICHYEEVQKYSSTHSVYFSYESPFKWTILDQCTFDITTRVIFTTDGANIAITNSAINITNIMQVAVYQSSTDCKTHLPENTGIANNHLYENNTFFGITTNKYR